MCTYNGAPYLREQLESFGAQTFRNWTLYVSDDGSTDATRQILSDYQNLWGEGRLTIFEGPCLGFAENFISLVRRPEVVGNFFAFSDQDDIWFPDKLERSIARLLPLGETKPALYCSRTRLVDANNKVIGFSPLFVRPPSFQNALVQSIAGANTMLVNQSARTLLLKLPGQASLVAHDWLTYLLVTGCGGHVVYDREPSLDYRQHPSNLIGANSSAKARVMRLRRMLQGRFVKWNDANVHILKMMHPLLTEGSVKALMFFDRGRKEKLIKRVLSFRKSGVYRQTIQGDVSLLLAVFLGKV
ncbi:glycosyltransferase family 2 protein [Pseudomonas sp. R1-18]|uniref:glycosyltransferase family 2 protein n=1 Tax=Pseudomonas sp. R1-18 TaxID=1632772 RepID=UPI003DA9A281